MRSLLIASLVLVLSACHMSPNDYLFKQEAKVAEKTPTQRLLEKLPAASQPIVLSVYDFSDQTGQQKPNDTFAEYSRAVTQGGVNMLYKALQDAGHGSWFTVIERSGLKNLLQERQLIRATREQYAAGKGSRLPDVDPLLYAGVIIEGGIVAYESNTLTGGAGASYLGVGLNTQYRRDMVTIYLRAVSVQNGEILASVNTSKTIYSTLVDGSIFKYVAYDELLQTEVGFSVNEPPQLAVRQAVEYGVYSLVMEGVMKGLWSFADPSAAHDALHNYLKGRDGEEPTESELSRYLGMSAGAPVVAMPAAAPPPPPPVTTPEQATPSADLYRQQPDTTPSVSQQQLPPDTKYVAPPAGQKPAEDKLKPQARVNAESQFFKNSASGGPAYDVVCTAQGCFPANASSGVPAGAVATGVQTSVPVSSAPSVVSTSPGVSSVGR